MDFERRILPFYMTYPGYDNRMDTDVLRDLEYLQQMYPVDVKKYQHKIAQVLDKMDYEGSMIYDEYPDRCSMQYLVDSMVRILRQEELLSGEGTEESPEKWQYIEYIVQVLLCNEIYKRRHGGRRSFLKF